MADLGTEKATSQMLENSRMMLERQVSLKIFVIFNRLFKLV